MKKEEKNSFEVSLLEKPQSAVRTYVKNANPFDVRLYVEYLEFTPQNWNQSQTVIVKGLNDNILDGDSHFFIELSPLESDDLYFDGHGSYRCRNMEL